MPHAVTRFSGPDDRGTTFTTLSEAIEDPPESPEARVTVGGKLLAYSCDGYARWKYTTEGWRFRCCEDGAVDGTRRIA
ncbi:MAG TPA: hypothetical protein VEA38_11265 [Terriglobales bacterium]|nr:hypothetical protein [Terriglobales bacterium]